MDKYSLSSEQEKLLIMKKFCISILVIILFVVIGLCGIYALYRNKCITLPFLYKECPSWSLGYYVTANPTLPPDTASIQWIKLTSFGVHPTPQLMADPFIVQDANEYYIFYEEFQGFKPSSNAVISCLHREDGGWKRMGVVLQMPYHLSFPNVFKYRGEWYMIPEAANSGGLQIFKAIDFPMKWEKVATALVGHRCIDNLVYQQNDTLFLFAYEGGLRIYYTLNLLEVDAWKEHPKSPIAIDRLAGGILKVDDKLYFYTQSSNEGYGTGVMCHCIDDISTVTFSEHTLQQNPTVWKHGEGVAKYGMHTLNAVVLSDSLWLCVTDGLCTSVAETQVKIDWKVKPTWVHYNN